MKKKILYLDKLPIYPIIQVIKEKKIEYLQNNFFFKTISLKKFEKIIIIGFF